MMRSVLFVDDEEGLRHLAVWDLKGKSFEVRTATDGHDALEKLSERAADVVVTDITMPKMGGLTLLEEIRTRYPAIPVIVVTGFGTVEMAVSAMKLGAFDFLLKPYEAATMEGVINQALDRARNYGSASK
jgi:DNA-binding NtrC family response regulator